MKKYLLVASILAVCMVLFLKIRDYTNIELLNHFKIPQVVYLVVFGIAMLTLIGLFRKIYLPFVITVTGISLILILSHVFEVELNYYAFEDERKDIIEKLVTGQIKKEDLYDSGFAFYPTPDKYKNVNREQILQAKIFSEEKHFVFFQTAKSRFLDFVGLTEGFVYSSTGKFPTYQELDGFYNYRVINDHWYFVSSDEQRFEYSCYIICEEPAERP